MNKMLTLATTSLVTANLWSSLDHNANSDEISADVGSDDFWVSADAARADIWSETGFSTAENAAELRALGSRRRRRRRRPAAPTPAPAPDRSYLSYPASIRISSGFCEDFHYEQITTTAACLSAGTYISGNTQQDFNANMPSDGWPLGDTSAAAGYDRPGGCSSDSTSPMNSLDLHYFPGHLAQCGTGGFDCLCRLPAAVSTTAVPYIVVRENKCATFGYERIDTADGCIAAGITLGRSRDVTAAVDSTIGSSRPEGCAYHSSNRRAFNVDTNRLVFFQQGNHRWPAGSCGTENFACICEHPNVRRARVLRLQQPQRIRGGRT